MLEKVRNMHVRLATALVLGAGLTLSGCSTLPDENKVANDWSKVCGVNVNLQQSGRFSVDPTRYGKDAFNETNFVLPVSCDKAGSLNVGDEIVDEFRWGSFITELGSFSNWDLSVNGKLPQPANTDISQCTLELTLRERHTGFAPLVFLKDRWNKQEFDWNVPCSVHDKVEVGHNFVTDEWRKGSMGKRMVTNDTGVAAGIWSVEVTAKKGPVLAQ